MRARDDPDRNGRPETPFADRKRVLLLTPRLLDTNAGRACTDLTLGLDRSRFEPIVCCYEGWGPLAQELHEAGVEIFPLKRRPGLDLTYMFALALEMRRRHIEVVHSLNARKAYVVGVLSGLLAGVSAGVATFHDEPLAGTRLLAGAGRLCGEVVGSVVATSEVVREALLRQRWVPPGKTLVIPQGVNLARFEGELRAPARALWGVPEDAPCVGAAVSPGNREELRLLRETFEKVRAAEPGVHLLLSGIAGRADGITGLGPFTDSPAFFAALDVLCVPLATRVVPPTLLDGLAAGNPIATSLRPDDASAPLAGRGGAADVLADGPWAFANVTAPGADALASGILELLRDRRAARALVREGRECVRTGFSVERHVRQVQELYER